MGRLFVGWLSVALLCGGCGEEVKRATRGPVTVQTSEFRSFLPGDEATRQKWIPAEKLFVIAGSFRLAEGQRPHHKVHVQIRNHPKGAQVFGGMFADVVERDDGSFEFSGQSRRGLQTGVYTVEVRNMGQNIIEGKLEVQ